MRSAEEIHQALLKAVLDRDWEGMRALHHPEYVYLSSDGNEAVGPDSGVAVAQHFVTAFPDLSFEIRRQFAPSDDVSVLEMTARGTNTGPLGDMPPTGREATVLVCDIVETRDGLLYREREYYDSMSLMSQLGALDVPQQADPESERQSVS